MGFLLPSRLSKPARYILSELHYSKEERLKYDDIFEDSDLDEEAFRVAFQRLIDKKYIEHHAPYYRLTSRGLDIAQNLPIPSSSKKNGTAESILAIIVFVAFMIILAGGGDESSSVPSIAQEASNRAVPQKIVIPSDSFVKPTTLTIIPVQGVEYRDPMPFQVGQVVEIQTPGANVRQSPGWINKSETDSVCKPERGIKLTIRGSPQYADGLWWWPVSLVECQGWTAQTTSDGKIILNALK